MLTGRLSRDYCLKCRQVLFFDRCSPTRHFSAQATRPVNHYASLGLTSSATQTEIKSAYYKLSKLYHPDVNSENEEASVKFRQITSAYEILGNLKLRKLYDKGLLPREGIPTEGFSETTEETTSRFHKTSKAKRTQPTTGKTGIYDFDEWSRFHYGTTLNRRNEAKMKQEEVERRREQDRKEVQSEYVLYTTIFVCAILFFFNSVPDRELDEPKKKNT